MQGKGDSQQNPYRHFIFRRASDWVLVVLLLGVMWALMACTPQEQAFVSDKASHDTPQAEEMAPGSQRQWLPAGKPRAVVIAVHGFNDYSNAFDVPARTLNARGIAVYSYDQRGFGTTPMRGIWAGERNLTYDLAMQVERVHAAYPGIPVYVLGESMGAAVAVLAVTEPDFPKVDGVVLVSPAFWGGSAMNGFYRSVLWVLAHTVPEKSLSGRDLKIRASDNTPMLRGMGRDPRIIKQTRIDAVYGVVRLMGDAFERVGNVKVPVLLQYGANDQVIPALPVAMASDRISGKRDVVVYPEGYHMLLRDYGGSQVLGDVADWILEGKRFGTGFDQQWQMARARTQGGAAPATTNN